MSTRRSTRNQNQAEIEQPPPNMPRHVCLEFPPVPEGLSLRKIYGNMRRLLDRQIVNASAIDFALADCIGLLSLVRPYLTFEYKGNDGETLFTCNGWNKLIRIQECVYTELVLEFYSTVQFDPTEEDVTNDRAFRFRLGGVARSMSIAELGWYLDIYDEEDLAHAYFVTFLEDGLVDYSEDYDAGDFWARIGTGAFDTTEKATEIRNPGHRLLHRLIASTVNQINEVNKVNSSDLFILWCFLERRHLNLPLLIATFLARKGKGARVTSPICGGHLITRLAKNFGISFEGMQRIDTDTMSLHDFERARLLDVDQYGTISIPHVVGPQYYAHPDPVPAPAPVPRPPRRHSRPRPTRGGHHGSDGVDLHQLARRVEHMQLDIRSIDVRSQWMGNALDGYFLHQGYAPQHPYPSEHGPFPYWYVYPPYDQ